MFRQSCTLIRLHNNSLQYEGFSYTHKATHRDGDLIDSTRIERSPPSRHQHAVVLGRGFIVYGSSDIVMILQDVSAVNVFTTPHPLYICINKYHVARLMLKHTRNLCVPVALDLCVKNSTLCGTMINIIHVALTMKVRHSLDVWFLTRAHHALLRQTNTYDSFLQPDSEGLCD